MQSIANANFNLDAKNRRKTNKLMGKLQEVFYDDHELASLADELLGQAQEVQ